METFAKLFERFLVFVYHCFDRIVIQGYLPLLTRPEHVVHFSAMCTVSIRSRRRCWRSAPPNTGLGWRVTPVIIKSRSRVRRRE